MRRSVRHNERDFTSRREARELSPSQANQRGRLHWSAHRAVRCHLRRDRLKRRRIRQRGAFRSRHARPDREKPQRGSSPHCGSIPGNLKLACCLNLAGVLTVEHPVPKMDSVKLRDSHVLPIVVEGQTWDGLYTSPQCSRLPIQLRIRAPGVRACSSGRAFLCRSQPATGGPRTCCIGYRPGSPG